MNRKVYIAILVALIFVESALSIPLKQYREINYNPCKQHRLVKTPKTCTCDSEDINLPEIIFHRVDPSNDKFIQRILYHSQIEDLRDLLTSTDWNAPQRKIINDNSPDIHPSIRKNYFEDDEKEERKNMNYDSPDIHPSFRKNYFVDNDERFAALDPRLRQQAVKSDNENEDHLAALDPRLRQQQPDNSQRTVTNNENPQQEAPLDQSEIPV